MCLTVQEVRDHAFRETCSFDVAYLLDHPRVTVVEGASPTLIFNGDLPGCGWHLPPGGQSSRSVKDPLASNEANVTGTVSVLVAAKDCGVPALLAPPRVIAK